MYFSALPPLTAALLLAGLTTLGACTLGGSSDGNTNGGNTNTGGTGTIDEEQNTGNTVGGGSSSTVSISVSGVAATGAPLLGARIRVIDALGKPINLLDAAGNEIGSDSSSTADGSFRITLAKTAKPVLPLILQARGQDAAGRPVVLHSLTSGSGTLLTANITPLTDATLAQLLGVNPAAALQTPNLLTILNNSTAVANSATQIKNVLKANLSAAKVATTTDLFQSAFTSNKTGQDLLLEGIRVAIAQDSNGKDILQLGNKLVRGSEVSIDLTTARTELSKTAGGDVSKAITSTLKASTSPTLTNLETLDQLGSSLNALIALNTTAAGYAAAPVLTGYTRHNGRTLTQLAARLEYYASRGYQLSNFQLTGCAEDPIPTKGCSNFGIAALVTDNKGNQVEAFTDVATYSTTNKRWELIGNGLATPVAVYPAAYASFDHTGATVAATSSAPNPVIGIEVRVGAADDVVPPANPTATISGAIATVPSGYGVPMTYCGQTTLCVSGVPAPAATGTPVDTLLLQTAKGWIGSSKDGAAGAQYQFNITPFGGASFTANGYLSAAVNLSPASRLYPQLDNVSAAASLTGAAIKAGIKLSWRTWASANPDLQVFSVKTLALGSGTPMGASFELAEIRIPDPVAVPSINIGSTSVTTAALASATAKSYEIWLGAQDSLGRRYYSKYTVSQ